MPVDTTHPQYDASAKQWKRCRSVIAGTDAVKSAGTDYLPKPNGHTDTDYNGYKMRAEFYPATQRTVDGLVGAVFRKEPQLEVPDGHEDLLEDTSLHGTDVVTLAKSIVRETLTVGRHGVLVDIVDGADKPFLAAYTAESIINWRVGYTDRKPVLTLVVLHEPVERVDPADPFSVETVDQYRVLQLGAMENDPGRLVYVQTVYERQKGEGGKETFAQIAEVIPTRRGVPLARIPFVFFGPLDLTPEVQKSPILDLVDVNLSHYRTSAELEEGAYFTGLPMYWVAGRVQGDDSEGPAEFAVGSRKALILDENGTAGVLTVDGNGMGLLENMMKAKEQRMAVLGARILEDQKSGVEAAATVQMRHRGENSLLGSLADTTSRGLRAALELMVWWSGVEAPEITCELNKDFISSQMTPKDIVDLTASFQTGTIGPEVFFKALKDGERVPDGWTKEDWLEDVEEGFEIMGRTMEMFNEDEPDALETGEEGDDANAET